ncbi:MAG: hypothetical protein R8G66_18930 [Cytophagales bacterium]|nr:hypothetical protein [Cytophagales bacterium]
MRDLVILTDPRYLDPVDPTPYDLDVLEDDQILMDACLQQGLNVDRKSWDDPEFDWSLTKTVIFRSTWDYFDRFSEFKQWLEKIKSLTEFINPQELVFWNVEKTYLMDLQSKGISIVPSVLVVKGSQQQLRGVADKYGWDEIVIKPTISATARDTHRLTYEVLSQASTQSMFDNLCKDKTMMIQPFLSRVLEEGELSIIVIDGKVTHGIRKVAKAGDYRVQSDFGGSIRMEEPDKTAIAFAEHVVKSCPSLPFYARVDLIKNDKDQWNLGEMELIEPELWFRMQPSAADALAKTIRDYLKK